MKIEFIYITNPTKKVAKEIARRLLKRKLIACANIFPINSVYWWEGKIADEDEFVLIAKTTLTNFKKVKKEVERVHPYKVPCILKFYTEPNKIFFEWLKNEVKN
ncbi:MAG: divalent-cation tolerance protein CutA [Candidatus Omnitrophica bacterium CG07_land_8_20_14_0_80_42_15]|uniref:Divalent-cation tolerance protein CutA n=1 Tax=Candidatus Aquitaenariimonas noxiae TaxID=1974741 RepID=A0A2J0KWT0_9BACT|nr:MAG: divalent-cation tolerance protein CutA [Candidatus Omnitrophica bacterium CG07_land_8_20_14_0_80_42_15]